MGTNPYPAHVTDAMWWLWEQLHALEPTSQLGGFYADKPGYHNTRDGNDPDDYSVREPDDQGGPDDKSSAIDWTFPEAQSGDYRRMAKYGARLRKAYDDRDPRLNGWREALGQTDLDATPEGLDFRHHTTRTPDSSHAWHWHLSCDRCWITSLDNMKALLSVLRGESLDAYLAAGGRLVEGGGLMADYTPDQMKAFPWQYDGRGIGENNGTTIRRSMLSYQDEMLKLLRLVASKVDIGDDELAAISKAAEAGVMAAVDDIVNAVLAALPDSALTKSDVEAAVRAVFADAGSAES